MTSIASRPGALKTLCALLLLAAANAVPPAQAADPARQEADLKALKARIADLDRSLAQDRRDRDALRDEVQTAEQELAQRLRALREAETAVTAQKRQVETARETRRKTLEQAAARRTDLAAALRALYTAGSPGRLQLLFRLDEARLIDRLEADAGALARALERKLAELQSTVAQLDVAEQTLAAEQATLERRSAEVRAALAAMQDAQGQRKRKLAEVAQREEDRATELARAKAEQARMEKLLEDLRRALRDSPMKFERGVPFKSLRGRLPWPLKGPLLARFGSSKAGGPLTWAGWWIGGEAGAPVRAVADGRVVYVGWIQRYGLVVILDHPGQYLTLYGHLQEAAVDVGEVVSAGGRLASAGASGGHGQNGVYFEIREGSTAVDPRGWLVP